MTPSVGIIILNWNSYDVTARCLESFSQVDYSNYEVILVDNGSSDDSGNKLLEGFPWITLLKNDKNLGFTGGNNTGIRYAVERKLDYIMLLNNDTVVTEKFLTVLIDSIKSDPKIGAIQPKILYYKAQDTIWNAGGTYIAFLGIAPSRGDGEKDNGQYDKRFDTRWITGCCFLLPRQIVEEIGPLDDKFFIYFEDADWSFKIRKLGKRLLYEPGAFIYHEAGMSDNNRDKNKEGNVSPFAHYQGVRNHLFMIRRYSRGLNLIGCWLFQFVKISGLPRLLFSTWKVH